MNMLKIAGMVVAALVVLVVTAGFLLPKKTRISRSVVVKAAPEAVYPLIANFKDGWSKWSAFVPEDDPTYQQTFEGPAEGLGAKMSWDSKHNADGWLKIVKSDPARGVELEMAMMQESYKATGSLLCEPTAEGTRITFTDEFDHGDSILQRYWGLAARPMLGGAFEKGLDKLKANVESSSTTAVR
jgi:hypothetical protein